MFLYIVIITVIENTYKILLCARHKVLYFMFYTLKLTPLFSEQAEGRLYYHFHAQMKQLWHRELGSCPRSHS